MVDVNLDVDIAMEDSSNDNGGEEDSSNSSPALSLYTLTAWHMLILGTAYSEPIWTQKVTEALLTLSKYGLVKLTSNGYDTVRVHITTAGMHVVEWYNENG